jgi:hypothetical protein
MFTYLNDHIIGYLDCNRYWTAAKIVGLQQK